MSTKSSLLVTVIVTVFADSSKLAFVTRQLCVVEVCRMATTAKIMIFLFNDFLFSNSLPSTISPICDCDVLGFDGAGYCLSSSMVVVVPIMLTL